jgi:tRNA G18 (ribose-2'-O)-methylase SpoU
MQIQTQEPFPMGLHKLRRNLAAQRKIARKRFERQRRANLLATAGRHWFVIVLDHLKPAFNIGKIFRSADAFGAREIHLVGIDFFNPAPAMGSFKWVPARFHDNFDTCYEQLDQKRYSIFTLDPAADRALPSTRLPLRSAFVFGHEEFGLSVDRDRYPDVQPLRIPQIGKVQSLNVSIAASVVMYEYFRQHAVR